MTTSQRFILSQKLLLWQRSCWHSFHGFLACCIVGYIKVLYRYWYWL